MRKKGSKIKILTTKISKRLIVQALAFSLFVILSACGFLYAKINYVPLSLYEEQSMMPKMKEAFYVNEWCRADFGQQEYVLWDKTRVDCLTKDYAIEFDFAKKWAESVGQSLYYSKMTGKKPAVVLILTDLKDYKYVKRVERIDKGIKIFLIKAY
jgi:hypothetical protein